MLLKRAITTIAAEQLEVSLKAKGEPIDLYTSSGYEPLGDQDAIQLAEALLAAVNARRTG